ncbi:MAG: arginine--tRNA ligase [Rhodospirillales bacterium]|jgi:arginyl-tRNA synthetase|nr:arginine--tRNA ligase [Rhodospirillales bacterium]
MNLFEHFRAAVVAAIDDLAAEGDLPPGLDCKRVAVDPPRDEGHGDVTTNAAMVLAKPAGMKPRDVAALLCDRLGGVEHVTSAEIAGPGFVNMRIDDGFWHARLAEILRTGPAYGDSQMGGGATVNVEYVSANPTGPLHVGHGRGAVVGDALASLLEKAGYAVTREYYVNDAGAQVDKLAHAAHWRYRQALGDTLDEAAVEYRGDYLIAVGEALAEAHQRRLADAETDDWLPAIRDHAVAAMMDLVRGDLALLGVQIDVFTSERALVEAGAVDRTLEVLGKRGLVYEGVLEAPKGKAPEDWEPREQTLFRATRFGDDVDRPLRKSDGSWTYFATDAAYHLDKFERGFATMIDVWGADHGGYVKRMRAVVEALTEGRGALDVKLCQMVNLSEDGKAVKMSKRAGTFVTLAEVIDKVGKDVVRFIMLTRKNDATLEFDLARVTEQSRDNPVFYVQYAHARACSVLRHAAQNFGAAELHPEALAEASLARLTDAAELALIKAMAGWPRLVESAAAAHEPHRVAFYLGDLAACFHALWNKGREDAKLRFLADDDRGLSLARLALVRGLALVIASGLDVIGVAPVEEMR